LDVGNEAEETRGYEEVLGGGLGLERRWPEGRLKLPASLLLAGHVVQQCCTHLEGNVVGAQRIWRTEATHSSIVKRRMAMLNDRKVLRSGISGWSEQILQGLGGGAFAFQWI
jgi:hypothetical protein